MASIPPVLLTPYTSVHSKLTLALGELSKAIDSLGERSDSQILRGALHIMNQLEVRHEWREKIAYRCCVKIWDYRLIYEDWEGLLRLSLEIGFRRIRPPAGFHVPRFEGKFPLELFDVVCDSRDSEAITDLAWASLGIDVSGERGLDIVNKLVNPHDGVTEPFPQGLGRTFTFLAGHMGSAAVRRVGGGRFIELLDRLDINLKDHYPLPSNYVRDRWAVILLEIIRLPDGVQCLATRFWEFLAEIVTDWCHIDGSYGYNRDVAIYLADGEEWDKLECWLAVVWMQWTPRPGNVENSLEDAMKSLFQQQPDAVQGLTQRMERWEGKAWGCMPRSFQETRDKLVQ